MSTLFWHRSAELILRSWPLSWPTAWPSSTPWRLRPLEPCLVPAACQFWAAPQLQMRRFNTRRLGRFSGVSDSFTESQRVGGSSSWGHLCHCHCYVVYHNLSYFQICSSLYCLPGRIAHLWSSMCIAWFCHRHDRTSEIAKQKKTWFVLMCGVVWCQGLCESALAADGWERFDFPGSSNLKWLKPRMTRRSQKKQNQDLQVLAASVMSGVCVDALAFTTLLAVSAQREQIVPWLKHAEDARNYRQEIMTWRYMKRPCQTVVIWIDCKEHVSTATKTLRLF